MCWLCDPDKYEWVEYKGDRVRRLVDEDDLTFVVVPRHSHVRHHLLVVLKRTEDGHKRGLIDCANADLKAMAEPIAKWCSILKRMGYDTVYSGCYSDEQHVHYHLIPFKFVDAKGFKGSAMHWLGCKEMFSDQRSWNTLDDKGKAERLREIDAVVQELISARDQPNK